MFEIPRDVDAGKAKLLISNGPEKDSSALQAGSIKLEPWEGRIYLLQKLEQKRVSDRVCTASCVLQRLAEMVRNQTQQMHVVVRAGDPSKIQLHFGNAKTTDDQPTHQHKQVV